MGRQQVRVHRSGTSIAAVTGGEGAAWMPRRRTQKGAAAFERLYGYALKLHCNLRQSFAT